MVYHLSEDYNVPGVNIMRSRNGAVQMTLISPPKMRELKPWADRMTSAGVLIPQGVIAACERVFFEAHYVFGGGSPQTRDVVRGELCALGGHAARHRRRRRLQAKYACFMAPDHMYPRMQYACFGELHTTADGLPVSLKKIVLELHPKVIGTNIDVKQFVNLGLRCTFRSAHPS